MTTDHATPAVTAAPTGPRHPLDPLSGDEITRSRTIHERAGLLTAATQFATVQLHEPDKNDVLAWRPGEPIDRQVFSVLIGAATGAATETVVSLTDDAVVSTRPVPTTEHPYGQPGLLISELMAVGDIVRADPRWQAAMNERGVTDHTKTVILPLAPGQFDLPDEPGRRLLRALTLLQDNPTDLPWYRPVEGPIAYVDLTERAVIAFFDHGSAPIPPRQPNLAEGDWGPVRTTLKPLSITQPDGPSFSVDGTAVHWENWTFRVGFDVREGLVLHQLGYDDGGRVRPVIYRGSVSEMIVPYADPHPMRFWISYFDEGEYGLGRLASPLTLGCDCLGEIHYFDATIADDDGNPIVLPNVVCMHEEDFGVLWKHHDLPSGTSETRRSRRLVISFWTAIGNYDYGFFWYLYQDGTIEFEAKLTGMVFAVATGDDAGSDYASPLEPGLEAPFHQHLFNVRLDMTVDGTHNTVEEIDVVGVATGDTNPYGNAFTTTRTTITSEADASRIADASTSRTWRVLNPHVTNHAGQPVAYKLMAQGNPVLLAQPDSSVAKRAAFATRHLWVTRYDRAERYAGSDYPNQHAGGAGLAAYQSANRSLVDEDIVIWHTFGTTHIPRAEDWPVMPVEYAGFMLKPFNFFDRNPSLDLPRSSPGSDCSTQSNGKAPCQ